jgi:hypothetical protein
VIADKLAALGIPPRIVVGIIVLAFTAAAGVLAALYPGEPWVPAVAAFLAGVAALIDPNGAHPATTATAPVDALPVTPAPSATNDAPQS